MITFREVSISDAKLILDWRTKERVTQYMTSTIDNDIEAQEKWLRNSFSKPDYYFWIIQYGRQDVGLIYLEHFNPLEKVTSWGFYIGEDEVLGIGGMIPPYFYNFAFGTLCVDRVNADVIYNNVKTIQLHLRQGYSFDPTRDYTIEKDGKELLMVCLSLQKKVFLESKFSRLKTVFPIDKWDHKAALCGHS